MIASGEFQDDAEWLELLSEPMTSLAISHFGLNKKDSALILDIGCGYTHRLSALQTNGNIRIIGLDLNLKSLLYRKYHFSNGICVLGNIEALPFCENTFDRIFSFSVLQYVDWQKVIMQCERLLKPGGRAVFVENLAGNLFLKVYRMIHTCLGWEYAPYQTPRKHIKWRQLKFFRSTFHKVEFTPFYLTTPIVVAMPALKKGFFGEKMHIQSLKGYAFLRSLDSFLLEKMPFLAPLCWIVVIRATKRGINL